MGYQQVFSVSLGIKLLMIVNYFFGLKTTATIIIKITIDAAIISAVTSPPKAKRGLVRNLQAILQVIDGLFLRFHTAHKYES